MNGAISLIIGIGLSVLGILISIFTGWEKFQPYMRRFKDWYAGRTIVATQRRIAALEKQKQQYQTYIALPSTVMSVYVQHFSTILVWIMLNAFIFIEIFLTLFFGGLDIATAWRDKHLAYYDNDAYYTSVLWLFGFIVVLILVNLFLLFGPILGIKSFARQVAKGDAYIAELDQSIAQLKSSLGNTQTNINNSYKDTKN